MNALGQALCKQLLAHAPQSSLSSAQVPSFGAAVQFYGRVEDEVSIVTGPDGRQLTTTKRVFSPSTEVLRTSRIWLPPDGDTLPPDATKARQIAKVEKVVDGTGATSHWEILV